MTILKFNVLFQHVICNSSQCFFLVYELVCYPGNVKVVLNRHAGVNRRNINYIGEIDGWMEVKARVERKQLIPIV